MPDEREDLAEAMLAASRALVGIAIHGLGSVASELLGVNQSNASRHTTRLVDLDLVTREKAPHDARSVVLRITESGRRRVEAVRIARLREIRSVLARMEVTDARGVATALHAFAGAADVSAAHEVSAAVP